MAQTRTIRALPLVELTEVCRSFDNNRIVALDGISLRIDKHERIAIVGPSGSGKSTLLNVLCGLDEPTSGAVRFEGQMIIGRTAWAQVRARRIGIVFQNFCLIPGLNARENIEVAMLGQRRDAGARGRRALALLEQMGLAHRVHLRPAELSGGERQRVAIARALANEPDILVADEPTGSLDQKSSHSIMEILTRLQAGIGLTLILVTHDHSVAAYCNRQIEIVDGRIASDITQPAATGES
jgi:ABC-type lipoprotein export system ATPase subunit